MDTRRAPFFVCFFVLCNVSRQNTKAMKTVTVRDLQLYAWRFVSIKIITDFAFVSPSVDSRMDLYFLQFCARTSHPVFSLARVSACPNWCPCGRIRLLRMRVHQNVCAQAAVKISENKIDFLARGRAEESITDIYDLRFWRISKVSSPFVVWLGLPFYLFRWRCMVVYIHRWEGLFLRHRAVRAQAGHCKLI